MNSKNYLYVGPDEKIVLENVNTAKVVVDGLLIVNELVHADMILGKGILQAGEIQFGSMKIHSVKADTATGNQMFVNRASFRTAHVRDLITATDYLEADSVITHKLTASLTNVQSTQAEEILSINSRGHGFLWTLFTAWVTERKIRRLKAAKGKKDGTGDTPDNGEKQEPILAGTNCGGISGGAGNF